MQAKNVFEWSNRRTACPNPNCDSKHGWAPLADNNPNNEYGKCWSCGYSSYPTAEKPFYKPTPGQPPKPKQEPQQQFISKEIINSLPSIEHSNFGRFFGDLLDEGFLYFCDERSIKADFNGNTVFPLINVNGDICNIKTIPYLANGHRNKEGIQAIIQGDLRAFPAVSGYQRADKSIQFFTKKQGYKNCLFNEFWLNNTPSNIFDIEDYPDERPIYLVESEKTALIAEFFYPDKAFIGTGGISGLSEEKAKAFKNKYVFILPDNDEETKRQQANKTLINIRKAGGDGIVFEGFLKLADSIGEDLADTILRLFKQKEINL